MFLLQYSSRYILESMLTHLSLSYNKVNKRYFEIYVEYWIYLLFYTIVSFFLFSIIRYQNNLKQINDKKFNIFHPLQELISGNALHTLCSTLHPFSQHKWTKILHLALLNLHHRSTHLQNIDGVVFTKMFSAMTIIH